MSRLKTVAGYSSNGLPYNRFGQGSRTVVVFQGLMFENKPLAGFSGFFMARMYRFLEAAHTTYIVTRKAALPDGYSMKDMADDYAEMIRNEVGGPVDIIGVSTGGSIAQHFAADHPDLVSKLVLHSSAHTLDDEAKRVQLRVGHLAQQGKWRAAYSALMGLSSPQSGITPHLTKPLLELVALFGRLFFGKPENPSDLAVTIEAEDTHAFEDRLQEIKAPTLVVAGDRDPFYSISLFRETTAGIPNAKLILYEKMGHPATGKQFQKDVLAFLHDDGSVSG